MSVEPALNGEVEARNVERVLIDSEERRKALVALNAALAAAQGEFPSIPRSRSVQVETRTGGSFTYDYAPLEVIVEAIRPILAKHGLAVVQLLESGPSLRTELRHREGGVLASSFPFKGNDNPQALGSAISYVRRYALVSLLGLVTEHDDDGAQAVDATESGPRITDAQNRKIGALLRELNEKWPPPEGTAPWVSELHSAIGVRSRTDMTKAQASEAIDWLQKQIEAAELPFG